MLGHERRAWTVALTETRAEWAAAYEGRATRAGEASQALAQAPEAA